jgi:hypothetical protein
MRYSLPLALAFVVLAAGCGGSVLSDGQGTDETLAPGFTTVAEGATQQYTITFNDTNTASAVTWEVQESGGGTLTTAGGTAPLTATYTAPNTLGTFHVKALVTVNGAVQTVTATVLVD